MSNLNFDKQSELQKIKHFTKIIGGNSIFPSSVTNVYHRNNHLASILLKVNPNDFLWRCYLIHPLFDEPLATLNSLSMYEALFIYRTDFWHQIEYEESECNDEEKLAILVAILYNGEVAGTINICYRFLAFILTKFSNKNVCNYDDFNFFGSEKKLVNIYINDLKSSAAKSKKLVIANLGKVDN